MNPLWPLLPLLVSALLVAAGSYIADGWRVKQADRKNPRRALGRCVDRAKEQAWNR